jgi:hypothetical protein
VSGAISFASGVWRLASSVSSIEAEVRLSKDLNSGSQGPNHY